jgi:hypothetical protein
MGKVTNTQEIYNIVMSEYHGKPETSPRPNQNLWKATVLDEIHDALGGQSAVPRLTTLWFKEVQLGSDVEHIEVRMPRSVYIAMICVSIHHE